MKKRILVLAVLALCMAGGALVWRALRPAPDAGPVVLYGNVDLRQVSLAFKDAERVARVLAREGDRLAPGALVAVLETDRLDREISRAKARVAAQAAALARLENGSRPQEKRRARADADAAAVELANAERTFARLRALSGTGAAREQDVDDALAARDRAAARLRVAQAQLALVEEGPRREDIDEARAALAAQRADLAVLEQRRADSELRAPLSGVVRSRLLEPGDMASAQRPVCTVAITDPKWVRAYLTETQLGRVHEGMPAEVAIDARPGQPLEGWLGFISPTAEFTPRNVETPELRTSLVYEARVFVRDPGDVLRLGMPATVTLREGHAVPVRTGETRQANATAAASPTAQAGAPPTAQAEAPQ